MRRLTIEDFWSKVDKGAGANECWLWTRALSSDGYGHCWFMGEQLAHRIAYKLEVGEIPKGKCVLHRCDNRRCCNPKHLFIGTRVVNNRDRDAKGRTARGDRHGSRTMPGRRPRGEKHSRSKLTDQQVREIRELYAGGEHTHRSLGGMFRVSKTTVTCVVSFQTRKDVT